MIDTLLKHLKMLSTETGMNEWSMNEEDDGWTQFSRTVNKSFEDQSIFESAV
jgi:hypothetical protein